MPSQTSTRKLTAIFYADVAAYSRLTGEDELGTHHRVMSVLDAASATVDTKGGKVLRYAGDAILAEFSSVVAAVEAAVEIQTAIASQNLDESENKRLQIRIGVHLGEVLQDRNEIFGDGVNLAAGWKQGAAQCPSMKMTPLPMLAWDVSALSVVNMNRQSRHSTGVSSSIQVTRWLTMVKHIAFGIVVTRRRQSDATTRRFGSVHTIP
jgi:hypothetical protein